MFFMNEKDFKTTAVCLTALSQLDNALYSIKDVICGAAFPVRSFITDEKGILDENKLTALSKELAEYADIYYSRHKMFIHDSDEQFYWNSENKIMPEKQKQAYENFFYCALTALYDNKRPYSFAIDQFARKKVADKSILPFVIRTSPDSFAELADMAAGFDDEPVGYRFYLEPEPFMEVLEGIYAFNGGKGGCCSRPLDKEDMERYSNDFDGFFPPAELDEMLDISDMEEEIFPEKKLMTEYDRYLNDEKYKELTDFIEPFISGLDSNDTDDFIEEIESGQWYDYMDFFADFHFSGLEDKYSYEDLKGYLKSISNLLKEREYEYHQLHSNYGWNEPAVTWSLEKYREFKNLTEDECRKQIHLLTAQKRKKLPDFRSFEKHFHDFLYTAEYLPDRQTRKDCVRNAVYLFLYNNEKVGNISALKDDDTLEYYLAMLDVCKDKIEQKRKRGDVL